VQDLPALGDLAGEQAPHVGGPGRKLAPHPPLVERLSRRQAVEPGELREEALPAGSGQAEKERAG
jgi:hypothetical protein